MLDVLVNNVGDFLNVVKPFERTTEEEWDALYAVNLRHMFLVTRAAIPLLRHAARGASIINLSTIEAFRGIPMAAVYSAFKSAVTGFTRSLALELGPHGIRVNAIAPETTETEQVKPSLFIPPGVLGPYPPLDPARALRHTRRCRRLRRVPRQRAVRLGERHHDQPGWRCAGRRRRVPHPG